MDSKDTPKHSHYGHRKRMKEKYLKSASLDIFEDHEILEMILFYCCPRKDTNDLAHKMLEEFMTLSNLLEATPDAIMSRCEVSEHVAIFVSMISRLTSRYLTDRWQTREAIDDSEKAKQFVIKLFAGRSVEYMFAICLNAQRRLINAVLISSGTVTETAAYPRRVAEAVLANQAVYVILAHNHPGGTMQPSKSDLLLTSDIVDMLKHMGITVLDHIIVSGAKTYSFSAHDRLNLG